MAVKRGSDAKKPNKVKQPATPSNGRSGRPGTPPGNGQAAKAAANKALGKVKTGGTRQVTIAQVQNDPSLKGKTKERIIQALKDRNKRQTEG